jgi:CelD/BcsL family acetyltransferase involved in cellulose biosynthesis
MPAGDEVVDEIGYLFLPPKYNYDMSNYLEEFSRKSVKKIRRELAAMESQGVAYRCDEIEDFDLMVDMSLARFGNHSYFFDHRFRDSFRALAQFLKEKGWLRFTTVLINGEPAATDMGCIYGGVYTLIAGGTNSHYPGVAKLINFHHMKRACRERLDEVDFLCGNFNWKDLFHLTPRPLYLLMNIAREAA